MFNCENDEIMAEIMKKAGERDDSPYEFLENGEIRRKLYDVQHNINIDRRWQLLYDKPIKSHRKITGKFIIFMKNKTKKFYKWYVDLLFDQQVEFNHLMWTSYYELIKEVKQLRDEVDRLKKDI